MHVCFATYVTLCHLQAQAHHVREICTTLSLKCFYQCIRYLGVGGAVVHYFLFTMGKKSVHLQGPASVRGECDYIQIHD